MTKTILTMQTRLAPDDFQPLDPGYFENIKLHTQEVGFWKASWRRLKENKIAMFSIATKLNHDWEPQKTSKLKMLEFYY